MACPLNTFQLTAARRRLRPPSCHARSFRNVSTHSRSKAAATAHKTFILNLTCFNSQPLEGGCKRCPLRLRSEARFQLTAARRRLRNTRVFAPKHAGVSTHSRSKAAACPDTSCTTASLPFQLTAARRRLQDSRDNYITRSLFQLTAARRRLHETGNTEGIMHDVSTHSRSKAAAYPYAHVGAVGVVSTHSRSKAAAR